MKGILGNQKVKIRKSNTYLIGIPGGKTGGKEELISKEIMAENFPEFKKEIIRFVDHTKSQAGEIKNKFTTIHVLVKENSQHRKAIGGGKQDTLAIEKIEVSAAKIVANRIFKV